MAGSGSDIPHLQDTVSSSAGAWAEPQLLSVGLDSVLAVLKLLMGGGSVAERRIRRKASVVGGHGRVRREQWEPGHTAQVSLSTPLTWV